jgi:hypothetical protein
MPAIKVIRRETAEDQEKFELIKLRDQWTKARSQLETEVLVASCSMPGCRTMPFVTLKTNSSRRPLCLRHFEMLRLETV